MSDNFKRYMTFTKSERIAMISIVAIIVIILIYKYLLIKNPPKRTAYFHNLDSIVASRQAEIDSLIKIDSIKKHERRRSFSKKSEKQKTGHDFYHKTGNKKTKFPDRSDSVQKQTFAKEKTIPIIDINTADTTLLKELPGIGSSFAKRIVEYRGKLGGFVEKEQLLEVYGMDSARYGNIENHMTVDSIFTPDKLRINYDSFKVLNRHPYLEYEDVKKIVNYREQKGLITSWEQLSGIIGEKVRPELEKYVSFQNSD